MQSIHIPSLSTKLADDLQRKLDNKAKPVGSLGVFEDIAKRIGLMQGSLTPKLEKPTMITVAADHGVTAEGVSANPPEITWQQVQNFIQGGGGIGLFCKQYGMDLMVVDAGVNYDFEPHPNLVDAKVRKGSRNLFKEPAMTMGECMLAFENGRKIVRKLAEEGCTIVGFGEMGIGNTTPASALLSIYSDLSVAECVGPGAGLDTEGMRHKTYVIETALQKHGISENPFENLARFGGLEIATICGGMIEAAVNRMAIISDGFITTSAMLVAQAIDKKVLDYTFFSHQSKEQGHTKMLGSMGAKALLNLSFRLGEGTGAAVAFSLIKGAVAVLNEMTSFDEGGVTNTSEMGIFANKSEG